MNNTKRKSCHLRDRIFALAQKEGFTQFCCAKPPHLKHSFYALSDLKICHRHIFLTFRPFRVRIPYITFNIKEPSKRMAL